VSSSVAEALARLDTWIETHDFQGWDPHDALNSPLLKTLTFGRRRLGQVWVQLLRRSPVNVRPLLRVKIGHNPKGMGLFLASYWRKYQMGGEARHLERARWLAGWLRYNAVPTAHGVGWGYNFDWPNRDFFAPAGTPTIVNTAFVGLALLDVWDGPGSAGVCSAPGAAAGAIEFDTLSLVTRACDFIRHDLRQTPGGPGEVCFSYTPLDGRRVHNANVLGAWLLAETAARTGEAALADLALAAARYTARQQRSDGSWLYGEAAHDNWVDGFHTGYVLLALRGLGRALSTPEFDAAVSHGYAYWKAHCIGPGGAPRFYPDRLYPQDAHSAAASVLTLLAFAGQDPTAAALAAQAANWAIENLQAPAGCFDYEIYRWYRIRIPYMRWTQAWMQRALTEWVAITHA
jgi:hypothetical protein